MHFLLRRAALCLDCESCFELGRDDCPACGGDTWVPLARFLELGKDDAGVAASARGLWSKSLDAVEDESAARHLTLEGFPRVVATARPVDIAEVKVAVPVRHERLPARQADHRPLLRKALAAGLVLVALGGVIVIGGVSRRALREHAAAPKATVPPEPAPRPSLVSNPPVAPLTPDARPPQFTLPKVVSKAVGPARTSARPAGSKTSPPRPGAVNDEPKRDAGGGGSAAGSLREFLKSVSPGDLGGKE
jgi:hypothetical protein